MADQKKGQISRPLPKLEELDTKYFWEETKKSVSLTRFVISLMKSFFTLGVIAHGVLRELWSGESLRVKVRYTHSVLSGSLIILSSRNWFPMLLLG